MEKTDKGEFRNFTLTISQPNQTSHRSSREEFEAVLAKNLDEERRRTRRELEIVQEWLTEVLESLQKVVHKIDPSLERVDVRIGRLSPQMTDNSITTARELIAMIDAKLS